ncbi:aspartate racemase [Pararhizobium capsulatum DSM 1112]|uniref:Aspartate racemase n=1 Tax=Pararhizobium capsulatum DSM 1112 TaxID=1121113 RepID=A0ABU0BS65_9HYPH|nr:aspartate/glutamate racemase family protein [Pararhizobium capsulatum]MDQ0320798.1 aspartate racemase [Pararhizobium capsulatum DSM 1112]
MRKIGLIGGMSFESSVVYYKLINEMVRERLGDLHSAEVLLHSVDFQTIVDMQKAGRWDDAAKHLADVASSLEAAGAACTLICTNTMHLIAPEVQAATSIPLIDIIDETAAAIRNAGRSRPLLLATRYTMEHGFYTDRMAGHGIDVMVPDADDRTLVHNIIFNELCAGKVLDASRDALFGVIERAVANGADSIILGCTEICLILDPENLPLPGFDSTRIHACAAVRFALAEEAGEERDAA